MVKTPAEKWKEQIAKLRSNCQKIMKCSNNIRYVGVINEYGRTLTGLIRPGVQPLLKSEQVKNEFFIISTLITLRNATTKSIGQLDHLILKHKKVFIVAFQKNKLTYYVSVDSKEKNLSRIISNIMKII